MEPLFLRACRGETTERTPLWLMRQAGRYLPEYRQVRAGVSFLELCKTPKLAAEVTLQPIRRFGFDAAILFSDLLVPLEAMGLAVEFTEQGPRLPAPLRAPGDLARVGRFDPAARTGFVLETIQLARRELGDTPLIGFAGAPFTVATYAIEGKTGKNFTETKTLFYREPETARRLLALIGEATRDYLLAQIRAGAQAVQLFDSWVGCLAPEDYRTFVLPHVRTLVAAIRPDVPVILFGTQTTSLLPMIGSTGAGVVGVDWRVDLLDAWASIGDRAVMGNLDPVVLFAPRDEVVRRTRALLDRVGGRPGHIVNLGHGILPQTPLDNVLALVETVHAWSA